MLEANKEMLKTRNTFKHYDNCTILQPSYIAPTAKITNSTIGPYATIMGNCEISHSVITDAIIDENTIVRDYTVKRQLVGKNNRLIGNPRSPIIGDNSWKFS